MFEPTPFMLLQRGFRGTAFRACGGPPAHEADDIAAGKKTAAVMAKATTTLKDAVDKAEKQTPEFRAVGVEPKSKANYAVAVVTLV